MQMTRYRLPAIAGLCLAAVLASCAGVPPGQGLVSARVLQRWHEDKARLGPTFAGSPAWREHVAFLERELRARGVVDVARDPVTYQRWSTADDPAAGQWSLTVDGQDLPVAGYWAYSGATPAAGVTAPLVLYDPQQPADLAGRIAVFEVPPLPDPLPPMFRPPASEYTSADVGEPGIATDQWYQVNYATRFGKFDQVLRKGGAAGAVVIFAMSPGRARGVYTFPLLSAEPVGVPGLYLDRDAGARVRAAAAAGRPATLRLLARSEPAEAWFLSAVLPGRDYGTDRDETVLLVTHTDGPNLTQENGGLAILAVIDHFARVPQALRRRSLLVLLDPQHYMPGRHLVDWYGLHPERAATIVASIGAEQFGQREYAEVNGDFRLTGRPETTLLFSQDNPALVAAAIEAVQAEGVPRVAVRVPARGQGQWAGLGDVAIRRRIPGYGTSTDMSAYWSTGPGIDSFDSDLCRRQVAVVTRLTGFLMGADLADIAPAR